MPGPQPWKGNRYSKGQSQPFQPWETPIQRRLRRKHREKQIEERTQHPQKNRTECQHECHEGRRNSRGDRKSTRLNSSHVAISYAVFCLKKKKKTNKHKKTRTKKNIERH